MAVVSGEEEVESLRSEVSVYCRKLGSKEEALKIIKRELDLSQERNLQLQQEIVQLQSQLSRTPPPKKPSEDLARERQQLITQLEEFQEKIASIERDLQTVEDEKDEVETERDYFAGQCAHLKRCMEEQDALKPPSQSAIHNITEENRHLRLQLVDCQAERDQALGRLERYKRALERRKARDARNQQLQFPDKRNDLRQSVKRVGELESLANSLSESVREKSVALQHQKKANKILASRIAEMEHRLKVLEISGLWSETVLPELQWTDGGEEVVSEGAAEEEQRSASTESDQSECTAIA